MRRQGVELQIGGHWRRLTWRADYTFLQATYQAAFTERSTSNSSADANGNIQVRPGDRIPGLPRNLLKLRANYAFTGRLSAGLSASAASYQYAYGNENNLDPQGVVPGYMVFNFNARYRAARGLSLFLRVDNLFNRDYYTFGTLGTNTFTSPGGNYSANGQPVTFLSPGAPRGAWIGMRLKF